MALVDGVNLRFVYIDADDFETVLGEGNGQGQAHIAQADACTERSRT